MQEISQPKRSRKAKFFYWLAFHAWIIEKTFDPYATT